MIFKFIFSICVSRVKVECYIALSVEILRDFLVAGILAIR